MKCRLEHANICVLEVEPVIHFLKTAFPEFQVRGEAGVNHLAYEVDDVESLSVRLKAAGYRESTPPNAHPYRKRVYFYDSEGNDWEFVQYFSQDPAERNDYALPDS